MPVHSSCYDYKLCCLHALLVVGSFLPTMCIAVAVSACFMVWFYILDVSVGEAKVN